jgi:hypothetical protein
MTPAVCLNKAIIISLSSFSSIVTRNEFCNLVATYSIPSVNIDVEIERPECAGRVHFAHYIPP